MKIRPKNNIIFAATGVKFSSENANGANWGKQIFSNYRQYLLDSLSEETNDFAEWLNEMQARHAKIYGLANQSGDWLKTAYLNDLVGQYQHDYKGDERFGTFTPGNSVDFNLLSIVKAQEQNRYDVSGPKRTSGDYGNHDFKVDNLYSAITDDRRLLGRQGDWDENSEEFKNWLKDLNAKGWETYLDTTDNYYKLRRLAKPDEPIKQQPVVTPQGGSVAEGHKVKKTFDFSKLLNLIPNIIEAGRLAGSLANNEKVYQASLAGLRPNLELSYNTHRQIVGDEASKLAYYRAAVQGENLARKIRTSDMDKQVAYMMEAKRIGDELRAKGDLIDNAEIRRTSDESNQHQWDNIRRNTEVANKNIAELNEVNAAKLNLLANKYSADWSSWDNYLKGREYRMRAKQANNEALSQQIVGLEYQLDLMNDPKLEQLKKEASEAYDKNDPTYTLKLKKYNKYKSQKMIDYYNRLKSPLYSAGFGMKLEYKRKDDLLYKSAKDTVEHFRKMAKMSNDSILKHRTKLIKLANHPKSRKLALGGVAPFTVFTPVALGGETSAKTSAASSSSEKSKSSDSLDLVKKLFLDAEGLPIDVNMISSLMMKTLKKAQLFGDEVSSSDLETLYLSSMDQINRAKFSKSVYEDAKKVATTNDALGEFAVTADGRYIALDAQGNISKATLELIKEKHLNPLTNSQLIHMREISPNLAFSKGDELMETVINNGIGLSKIAEQINNLKGTLGSSETTIQGYTKQESNAIKQGMELLALNPDGLYKVTQYTKDLRLLMQYAYNYIVSMLPTNMKAILTMHAYSLNTSPDKIISAMLNAGASNTYKFEVDAITGDAAKGKDGKSETSGLELDAATALVSGQGYSETMEFNTGTSYAVRVKGRHTEFLKHSGENMGQCTMDEALLSTLKGVLDFNKATFGGSKLSPANYNHILINDGTVIGVDLPTDSDGNPDFTMLKKLQTLDQVLLKQGIEDSSDNAIKVNKACQEVGLPAKYNNEGKLNSQSWGRFAAFQATMDEKALLNKNTILSDIIKVADDSTREAYINMLKSKTPTKDYDLSDGILGTGWLKDELYQGTVFVPVKSSYVAAAISSAQNIDMEKSTSIGLQEQGYDKNKAATYKPGHKPSDL